MRGAQVDGIPPVAAAGDLDDVVDLGSPRVAAPRCWVDAPPVRANTLGHLAPVPVAFEDLDA